MSDLRSNPAGQGRILGTDFAHPCYGQPDFTYCDVERAAQSRLHAAKTLATYRALRTAEIERAERTQLTRLREKYEGVPPTRAADLPTRQPPTLPSPRRNGAAKQPSLL